MKKIDELQKEINKLERGLKLLADKLLSCDDYNEWIHYMRYGEDE